MCLNFKVRKEWFCLCARISHISRATNQQIDVKRINAYTEKGKSKNKEFSYVGNLLKEMNNVWGVCSSNSLATR